MLSWELLGSLSLTSDWQLSKTIQATVFRLNYSYALPVAKSTPIGIAALAVSTSDGIELFSPTRIQPRPEKEILSFPDPPRGWEYALALKQIPFANQPIVNWSVTVDMPIYNLTGADPVAAALQATSFIATTPAATNTASKILTANPARKSASIYNPSTTVKVYLDVVSTVTVATASIVIPPGGVYIADLPWIGDVYGVVVSGSVTLQVREFV